MQIKSPKELIVYQKAYALAMKIFRISKDWPSEEKFSLTDQIRRSSRSVCTNLREAWAKRRYEAHFVSKLTDSDAENGETDGPPARRPYGSESLILQKIVDIYLVPIMPI